MFLFLTKIAFLNVLFHENDHKIIVKCRFVCVCACVFVCVCVCVCVGGGGGGGCDVSSAAG